MKDDGRFSRFRLLVPSCRPRQVIPLPLSTTVRKELPLPDGFQRPLGFRYAFEGHACHA